MGCYSGLPGTQGVGLCTSGVQTCLPDGSGYGPCTGEIAPSVEDCATDADEDCDGMGQCAPPLWSTGLGGAGDQAAYAVATDAAGNLYVTGWFEGTVDFGAGPLVSAGNGDVFVLKLDPAGHALWSRRFGSSPYRESGTHIALDGSGNILVGGSYSGAPFDGPPPVDFGGGPLPWGNDFSLSAVFLVKLDPDGNHLWTCPCDYYFHVEKRDPAGNVLWQKLLSGPSAPDFGGEGGDAEDVAVDAEDNLLVVGRSQRNLDLGGGPIADGTHFVVKMSPLGDYLWHREAPPDAVVRGSGGNFIVLAERSLVKLDASGAELWRRTFTDVPVTIRGLTTDRDGNIALVGDFTGTADFGTGPLTAAGTDGFVAVFGP
ncbi:SBBP repeat-containing protein [Sorangium sp. So ce321]|uniref:SBBP repeat-containing protein n=1 Tax=Sorangium sp. So ce321 TaxID=3133300 RepID=UPI003F63AF30